MFIDQYEPAGLYATESHQTVPTAEVNVQILETVT